MTKVVGICSLFEPLEFLQTKLENLAQCDLRGIVIYVADCSPAKTQNKVAEIITNYKQLPLIFIRLPKRETLYATWNILIRRARTEERPTYFTNVNVDDLYDPQYFQKMASFLDSHPHIQIASCPWYITKIKGQKWPPQYHTQSGMSKGSTIGHFPMWRSSLHEVVGFFDDRAVCIGDALFWNKIIGHFGHGVIAEQPETLACYLTHEKNLYYTAKGPHGGSGEAWDRGLQCRQR